MIARNLIFLFTLLTGLTVANCYAQAENSYTKFTQGTKTGIKKKDAVLIEAVYDSIDHLYGNKSDYFRCFKSNRCGIADSTGKLIYSVEYTAIHWANDSFDPSTKFHDHLFVLLDDETHDHMTLEVDNQGIRRKGLGDFNGNVILDPEYDHIYLRQYFKRNFAYATKDNGTGVLLDIVKDKKFEGNFIGIHLSATDPAHDTIIPFVNQGGSPKDASFSIGDSVYDTFEAKPIYFLGGGCDWMNSSGKYINDEGFSDVQVPLRNFPPGGSDPYFFPLTISLTDPHFEQRFRQARQCPYGNELYYSGDPIVVAKDGKYGLVDIKGRWVLKNTFMDIFPYFEKGRAFYCCKTAEKMLIYDGTGKLTRSFPSGDVLFMGYGKGRQIQVLNVGGKIRHERISFTRYDLLYTCNDKNTWFEGGKYIFLGPNADGAFYDSIRVSSVDYYTGFNWISPGDSVNFCNEWILDAEAPLLTRTAGGWGARDVNGRVLVPNQYSTLQHIKINGQSFFKAMKSGKFKYLDAAGKELPYKDLDFLSAFKFDALPGFVYHTKDNYYFTKDIHVLTVPVRLPDSLKYFFSELVYIYDGSYGYPTENDRSVVRNLFGEYYHNGEEFTHPFRCGDFLRLTDKNNKTGVIDVKGNTILPFNFESVSMTSCEDPNNYGGLVFSLPLFIVKTTNGENEWSTIYDSKGKRTPAPECRKVDALTDSILELETMNSFFLYDPYHDKLSPELDGAATNGMINYSTRQLETRNIVKKYDPAMMGVISNKLEIIIPFEYNEIEVIGEKFFVARRNNLTTCFDLNGRQLYPLGYPKFKPVYYDGAGWDPVPGYVVMEYQGESKLLNRKNEMIFSSDSCNITMSRDGSFRVQKNGHTSVVDSLGRIRFTVSGDHIGILENGIAVISKNERWGLINSSGKVLLPLIYGGFILERGDQDRHIIRQGKLIFQDAADSLYGLIDTNNNVILKPGYDDILVSPRTAVLVGRKGKFGAIDFNGKVINPLTHDAVYVEDELGLIGTSTALVRNGDTTDLFGMMDTSCVQLLPDHYAVIGSYESSCTCYPLKDTNGLVTYFDPFAKKINTGSDAFVNSFYGKYFLADTRTDFKPEWKETNGLTGCDATAFYVDEKGNYWLGTGSSGGVYFSMNKGKNWTARNKGIGPCHVSLIGKVGNTMYVEKDFGSLYYFKESGSEWIKLEGDSISAIIRGSLAERSKKNLERSMQLLRPIIDVKNEYTPVVISKHQVSYGSYLAEHVYDGETSQAYFPLLK
jgi:hypothetical protein